MPGRKRKGAKDIHVTPTAIKEEKETKANEPVEKKRKVTPEPRFIITKITQDLHYGRNPTLDFCRTEVKNQPGKFSILIRGEENAYKRATIWLRDMLIDEEEADPLFEAADKQGWTNKKLFTELHELTARQLYQERNVAMECRVTPCVTTN